MSDQLSCNVQAEIMKRAVAEGEQKRPVIPSIGVNLPIINHNVDQAAVRREINFFGPALVINEPGNDVRGNLRARVGGNFCCKFCNKSFINSQALGGHQNAHKEERLLMRQGMGSELGLVDQHPFVPFQQPSLAAPVLPTPVSFNRRNTSLGVNTDSMIHKPYPNSVRLRQQGPGFGGDNGLPRPASFANHSVPMQDGPWAPNVPFPLPEAMSSGFNRSTLPSGNNNTEVGASLGNLNSGAGVAMANWSPVRAADGLSGVGDTENKNLD